MSIERNPSELDAAVTTAAAIQQENPAIQFLREAGLPISQFSPPHVTVTDTHLEITITTPESTNSDEWKAAIGRLEQWGYTVERDYESMLDFTRITITAPKEIFRSETIVAITAHIERKAAATQRLAPNLPPRDREFATGC